jgi:hypothetical protein
MKRGLLVEIVAASILLTGLAWGKSSPKPSNSELAAITARGILLAEYDQAAWHATDAAQAVHPSDGKVKRYIARKTLSGWVVDFGRLDETKSKFLVAYEAIETADLTHFTVNTLQPERQDTGFDLAAAKSIDLALADFKGAGRPYNVAVLPDDPDGLFVYLYPAQTKDGVYPYGGDVRYLVAQDGSSIVAKRQLHQTVLESVPPSDGSKTVAGYHTHVLSDLPEDTDVLLVLSRQPKVPEYVAAGGRIFVIAVDGTIKIAK